MYFKYIWNNFLHIQVEICTAMILAMPPAPTDMQPGTEQEQAKDSMLIRHVRLLRKQKKSNYVFNDSLWG